MNAVSKNSKFRQIFNSLKNLECRAINKLPESVVTFQSDDDRVISLPCIFNNDHKHDDLTDPKSWQVMTIRGLEDGLIVVPNILTEAASEKWFHSLLNEWPVSRSDVLKSHVPLPLKEQDKKNLRWLTFGYHHDWSSKVYDMDNYDTVPEELYSLFCSICRLLDLKMTNPSAGIINYYNCKDRLSPHRDVSEYNHEVPLVSLSLGSAGIFMIGGQKDEDEEPIVPILVRNGDLIVMSGKRRLAYHAVPKVFCQSHLGCQKKETRRININVRQVL